ncbi:MAG: nucleotidyltransferase family protein [Bacteroidota bacterium]
MESKINAGMNTNKTENPIDELLILLSYNELREEEKARVNELCSTLSDWNGFYDLALFNKLVPHVYNGMLELNVLDLVPKDVEMKLERRATEIKQRNRDRLETGMPVLKLFNTQKIPFVVLKGVLFAETIYHNSYYKRMNDIDILVPKDRIPEIITIYELEGWLCVGERVGGNPEKQLKTSHHLPPYVHKSMKCMFGTQWGLKSPRAPYRIDYDAIWKRVRPFSFMELEALQMSPEDNLHHICVHLGYYKTSVRDVFDIYNLIRKYRKELDWGLFLEEVEKAGTQGPVYFALSLANNLCPMNEMQNIINRVTSKANSFFRNGVREKTKSQAIQLRIGSHYLGEIEKAISEFNATSKFGEKISYFFKVWKSLLWPPMEEARKINARLDSKGIDSIWIRLTSPFRLMSAIANEIGWTLLFGLMVKTVVDVILSLFTSGKSRRSIADYAREMGIDENDLQKLKDSIQ